MKNLKQIKRIQNMEKLYDEANIVLNDYKRSLRKYKNIQKNIKVLEEYYDKQFIKDYEDDEKGKIPDNIKRGVLSQDGLYNLFIENDKLKKQ